MTAKIAVGDKAPGFSLPRDGGGQVSMADFKGRALVLYFYPKADTEGCTVEAKDFSRLSPQFGKVGAAVLGVSADPVEKLDKFKAKHRLTIPLASDEQHKLLEAYGVWAEKSLYGRTFMGVLRSTYLIGPNGRVARVWDKVKVKGHAAEALEAAKALAG
jgi:thioredoxin-dependent peroxiredoxin